jgi:hypothetical protein
MGGAPSSQRTGGNRSNRGVVHNRQPKTEPKTEPNPSLLSRPAKSSRQWWPAPPGRQGQPLADRPSGLAPADWAEAPTPSCSSSNTRPPVGGSPPVGCRGSRPLPPEAASARWWSTHGPATPGPSLHPPPHRITIEHDQLPTDCSSHPCSTLPLLHTRGPAPLERPSPNGCDTPTRSLQHRPPGWPSGVAAGRLVHQHRVNEADVALRAIM